MHMNFVYGSRRIILIFELDMDLNFAGISSLYNVSNQSARSIPLEFQETQNLNFSIESLTADTSAIHKNKHSPEN